MGIKWTNPPFSYVRRKKKKKKAKEVLDTVEKAEERGKEEEEEEEAVVEGEKDTRTKAQKAYDKVQEKRVYSMFSPKRKG